MLHGFEAGVINRKRFLVMAIAFRYLSFSVQFHASIKYRF